MIFSREGGFMIRKWGASAILCMLLMVLVLMMLLVLVLVLMLMLVLHLSRGCTRHLCWAGLIPVEKLSYRHHLVYNVSPAAITKSMKKM
jgi:hypothetical protein